VEKVDPANLPDGETLREMAHQVARNLTALRHAPVVDPIATPAILRGRAAAVFFHEILGHRVEGHRQKDEDEGGTLADMVGQRVFPNFLSIYDDPTLARWEAEDLAGHYAIDDEGVRAERVTIVEDGVLKGFLMSRAPIENFAKSNGHGRRQPGEAPVARQGNLIITAKNPVTYEALRARLVAEVKAQGKPFGLIFDDISGGFTLTGRGSPNSYAVQPVTVWRVWPDGRPDELVRGADLIGTPLVTFERILAASDRPAVFNGVCGAESGWVPVAGVAPDILVREIEVQRQEKQSDRPPLLPPPNVRPPPDPAAKSEVVR
jgi:predicted Zn-dependent protease